MKALIVDDEKHVRDAIRMLIDWDHHGIKELYEAAEGASAMEIIQAKRPQIVFTDMRMPLKDGVELMQWLHRRFPECKTIVISGHDDFEYVRNTVQCGGIDYLLKPIDADELNGALAKAIESWNADNEARKTQQQHSIEMNQIKPVYWDKVFSNIVQQSACPANIMDELLEEFEITKPLEKACIAIMNIDTVSREIKQKFAYNMDLLFFTLANIANEYLLRDRSGYAFRYLNSMHELVIISWESAPLLMDLIQRILDGIRRTLRGTLDIGIGTAKPFPTGIHASYLEAQATLKQRNLLQASNRIQTYKAGETPRMVPLPFNHYEADLRAAILSNQEIQLEHAVSKWIAALAQFQHISVEQMELWNHEYEIFKARCINEYMKEDPVNLTAEQLEPNAFLMPIDDEGRLSLQMLQEEVMRDLQHVAAHLAKLMQRERNIIYEIVDYIDQHYHLDLTLQHISDQFYLSREYISRRFKQELQENISDYITRIRIEKAELLLHNPQLKINEIAEMVGYRDEKYFSKVFKKINGLSPNEYRKRGVGH